MILFGYKNKFSSYLRALAAIAIGMIMFVGRVDAFETLAKVIGAIIIAAGIASIVFAMTKRGEGTLPLMSANAVLDVIIGILLFSNPAGIAAFIPKIIAFLLIVFCVIQFVALLGSAALLGSGRGGLLVPVLLFFGAVMILTSTGGEVFIRVLCGILLVMYGFSELASTYRLHKAKDAAEAEFTRQREEANEERSEPTKLDTSGISDAKEVEYTKED
ncbi:MAG: DUF308 domain-containing protein [Bacteroidales bacterium]|nr:DUF308 domain-containing protein [Bacteroidales bacterium]